MLIGSVTSVEHCVTSVEQVSVIKIMSVVSLLEIIESSASLMLFREHALVYRQFSVVTLRGTCAVSP